MHAPLIYLRPSPNDAAVTGGDLYNARMVEALSKLGCEVRPCDLAGLVDMPDASAARPSWLLCDSLYYEQADTVSAEAQRLGARLVWLVHWLPSSVRLGRAPRREELTAAELSALGVGEAFVVPGSFVADCLRDCGVPPTELLRVEPGSDPPATSGRQVPPLAQENSDASTGTSIIELLCVGNLVPAKGQLELVQALVGLPAGAVDWRLELVGADLDAQRGDDYAARVRAAANDPRVRLRGRLERAELEAAYARAHVFVSASRMESYGLAIAEARARGLLLCVREGGEAAAHVDPKAGGRVFGEPPDLREELRAWMDAPERLVSDLKRARENSRHRTWQAAARDLVNGLDARA